MEKKNSKQNLDYETRIGVDNETKYCCDIRILKKFCWKSKNSKQNFDYETRIGVDNVTKFCYDIRILTKFWWKSKILSRI